MNTLNNPQYKNSVSVPFQVPRNLSDSELRQWLIEKIELIDATKRSVTEQLSRYHDATMPRERDRNFYVWIKRAKSYKSHLTEERARLMRIKAEVNQRLKQNHQILNNKPKPDLQFSRLFMMAAEEVLEPELFQQIEARAMAMLEPK